jgi:hypothetical protein
MIGRSARARKFLHESGAFRQAHHSQPERHDADQTERNCDRGFCAVERAVCDFFPAIVPTANRDRQQYQRQPNVIQHFEPVAAVFGCDQRDSAQNHVIPSVSRGTPWHL